MKPNAVYAMRDDLTQRLRCQKHSLLGRSLVKSLRARSFFNFALSLSPFMMMSLLKRFSNSLHDKNSSGSAAQDGGGSFRPRERRAGNGCLMLFRYFLGFGFLVFSSKFVLSNFFLPRFFLT